MFRRNSRRILYLIVFSAVLFFLFIMQRSLLSSLTNTNSSNLNINSHFVETPRNKLGEDPDNENNYHVRVTLSYLEGNEKLSDNFIIVIRPSWAPIGAQRFMVRLFSTFLFLLLPKAKYRKYENFLRLHVCIIFHHRLNRDL